MNETDKLIQEYFETLPQNIKQAVLSPKFESDIEFIRNQHALSIDTVVSIQNETFLLMIGLVDPEDFVLNLAESLNITPEEADLLALDIVKTVVAPVKDSLTIFVNSQSNSEEEEGEYSQKAEAPENLPVAQTHLEPMILSKNQNQFLPPLVKKETLIPNIPTNTLIQKENQTPSRPKMSSAIAAEMSNLLGGKNQEAGSQAGQSGGTVSQPPSPFISPYKTTIPQRPEDKMNMPVQKSSFTVQMTQEKPTPEIKPESQGDPYREPIE